MPATVPLPPLLAAGAVPAAPRPRCTDRTPSTLLHGLPGAAVLRQPRVELGFDQGSGGYHISITEPLRGF